MEGDLEKCPVCDGSGDDPVACGCQCFTDEQEANCDRHKCANCGCAGCGGSCPYCGGSGKKKDWKPGGPYPRDYVPQEEKG